MDYLTALSRMAGEFCAEHKITLLTCLSICVIVCGILFVSSVVEEGKVEEAYTAYSAELDSMDDEQVLTEFRRWRNRDRKQEGGRRASPAIPDWKNGEEVAPEPEEERRGILGRKKRERQWKLLDPDRPRLKDRINELGNGLFRLAGGLLVFFIVGSIIMNKLRGK